MEDLGSPKVAQIFAYGKYLFMHTKLLHDASDMTNKGSERIIPRKKVAFGVLDDVSLNFGSQTTKSWNFEPMSKTFKRERQKKSNTYNLNITKPIITKFSQETATMNGLSWWSHDFPNESNVVDGGHIEFRKMLILWQWIA